MIFTSVTTNIRLMSVLFLDFFRVNPLQVSLTLLLMLFRSMSSGVGLLLILPLLQVVVFQRNYLQYLIEFICQ